jgi:streptogramin lyase
MLVSRNIAGGNTIKQRGCARRGRSTKSRLLVVPAFASLAIAASAQAADVELFRVPDRRNADELTTGPGGNVWFVNRPSLRGDNRGGKLVIYRVSPRGTITQYQTGVRASYASIAQGFDDEMWIGWARWRETSRNTFTAGGGFGRLAPGGKFVALGDRWWLGSALNWPYRQVTAVSNGRLWYAGISRVGFVSEFEPGSPGSEDSYDNTSFAFKYGFSTSVAPGPDSSVWFTRAGGRITKIRPPYTDLKAHSKTFRVKGGGPGFTLISAVKGSVWFANSRDRIGRLDDDGRTRYLRTGRSGPLSNIVVGPDGRLWWGTERGLAAMTRSGRITRYRVGRQVSAVAVGPHRRIWFATVPKPGGNYVGRFTLRVKSKHSVG